jgi:hypothetical protein
VPRGHAPHRIAALAPACYFSAYRAPAAWWIRAGDWLIENADQLVYRFACLVAIGALVIGVAP